jgi:hypothetical protein
VSLASGDGLIILALGGEVVALEPGGAPGCDYYGVSIPGYHGTGSDAESREAAPAGFEENRGQLPAAVRYAARGAGHTILVGREGAALALGDARVELRVRGGEPARAVRGAGRLPGVVNDYRGSDPARWRTGIALYRRVRVREVAPGVDLALRRGGADRFAYDLVLRPGADAGRLALEFRGGGRPRLDGRGALLIGTGAGVLRQPPPVAYQYARGQRVRVPARFRIGADGSVSCSVASTGAARW